jgi:septum formation protein
MKKTLWLSSQSPRRAELLSQIGVWFRLLVADIDETPSAGEAANDYVERMAREKAEAGFANLGPESGVAVVLGADTAVVVDGDILGKPVNAEQARQMLQRLSGREHEVLSAVCVRDAERSRSAICVSRVQFEKLTDERISAYLALNDYADKAGAYGIQGAAAAFIAHLDGSYSAVMGLPLYETAGLLDDFQIDYALVKR